MHLLLMQFLAINNLRGLPDRLRILIRNCTALHNDSRALGPRIVYCCTAMQEHLHALI